MQSNTAETSSVEIKINRREMSAKSLIGDGIGMFGVNIFAIGFYSILLYYYTDVAGIATGIVGTLILISRCLDGFTDLIMGNVLDRTNSKYGKARPWLLWLSIPTAITGIALFFVPDIGSTGKMIYIIFTNFLFFSIGTTGLSIAYYSLVALTTKNPYDRSLMGVVRGVFGFLAGIIMSVLFIPVVASMGNNQNSWTTLITVFAVLAVITILISFKSTKEVVFSAEKVEKEKQTSFKQKFRALFKNKYLVIILVLQVINTILSGLTASAGVYYAQYIWQNVNLVAVIGGVGLLPMLLGFMIIAPLVKKFGKRNIVMIGAALTIIGNLVRLIDPYSVPVGIAGMFIAGLGMVPTMTLLHAMLSDTIEYGEWKTGMRMEGLVNSGMSFFMKVGNGLATAMIGWLLAFGGYVAGQEIQSALANQAIIAINVYIPIILGILTIIAIRFYKLDDEYAQILSDLESR